MNSPTDSRPARLASLLSACEGKLDRFAHTVLGRSHWSRQREICNSVDTVRTTVVPAGNGVGKSYVGSNIVLGFLYSHPQSIVFTSAPSQYQLESVLWKEIASAHKGSRLPLGGKVSGSSPVTIQLDDRWFAYGHVSNKVETMSGKHKRDLLAVVDEASGASETVYDALDSLNPSRILLIGNPLHPSGRFFDLCNQADDGAADIRKIVIPSMESPDAHLERSPRGMADRTWIDAMRRQYGEESLWWLSHVLAKFPGESDDTLIPRAWLDIAGRIIHVPSGPRRMAIDLGLGVGGGDHTVLAVRDDDGLLDLEFSRSWNLETAAFRAKMLALKYGVEPHRISWDAGGIGADFENRLETLGLVGCQPYLGGSTGGKVAGNMRSAAAWAMRQRLDPKRMLGPETGHPVVIPQRPFAIGQEHLAIVRGELEALRYGLNDLGLIALELKEDFAKRIRHSPDFADALTQLFAYTS